MLCRRTVTRRKVIRPTVTRRKVTRRNVIKRNVTEPDCGVIIYMSDSLIILSQNDVLSLIVAFILSYC